MPDENKEVRDYLEYYLRLPVPPAFAVLIGGGWGSGKTWFVNSCLAAIFGSDSRGKKYVFVSLYGLENTAQIQEEMFRQLHPVLCGKGMKIAGGLLKGLLKGTFHIDMDGDGKQDGKLDVGMPDLDSGLLFKVPPDLVIVFDDFERCNIPMPTLLGYINHFVEFDAFKVLVVANEAEIGAQHRDYYARTREKLIGRSFVARPSVDAAIESFIGAMIDPAAKIRLMKERERVTSVFHNFSRKNLRVLRQVILDFDRVFGGVNDLCKANEDFIQSFVTDFFMLSLEVKVASISLSDLREVNSAHYVALLTRKNGEKSESLLSRLRKQYGAGLPFRSEIAPEVWVAYFETGSFNMADLACAINGSSFFRGDQPAWLKLWHGFKLSDDEFDDALSKTLSDLTGDAIGDIGVLMHVVAMLLSYSKMGLVGTTTRQILRYGKTSARRILEGQVKARDAAKFVVQGTGHLGFGYIIDGNEAEFKEFVVSLEKMLDKLEQRYLRAEAKALPHLMDCDVDAFAIRLVPGNSQENEFWNTPILAEIKPTDFVQKIAEMSSPKILVVAEMFAERYRVQSHGLHALAPEIPWLEKVANRLSRVAHKKKGRMSGVAIRRLVDRLQNIVDAKSRDPSFKVG